MMASTSAVPAGLTDPTAAGRMHPIGWVAGGLLVLAAICHSLVSTDYMIGNFSWWQWTVLAALLALATQHDWLHRIRIGLEKIGTVSKFLAWTLAWVIFVVQLFNVTTRYANPLVEQDILIGQMTSLAWQSFAMLALIGVSFGVRDGVNPRIDFWWAKLGSRARASLDFVLHVTLLLPFIWMATRLLDGYAKLALGQKRDGTWPEGWRVWRTWEQSPDADQLPVGFIKSMIFVSFVLFGLQIIAELIKTGFVMIHREDLGAFSTSDAPQRVE